jgi:PPOX class probable F420-dependent enzyme
MMSAGGRLYFMTPASSWKARRIANNPRVTLALCAFRGQALGPAVEGMARRLAGSDARQAQHGADTFESTAREARRMGR